GEAVAEEYGPQFYAEIGRRGGERVAQEYGPQFYSEIGRRGGLHRNKKRKAERRARPATVRHMPSSRTAPLAESRHGQRKRAA
ncbi:MAG: hypothetical protein C5B49_03680, partial [Bdellovibrio sp.]